MSDVPPSAVLIVGPYGAGKSTVAAELADVLERADRPFALLDIDYLMWANPPEIDVHDDPRLMLANLAAVTRTYRQAGIRLFVLAGYVASAEELDGIRTTLEMPLTVVRLEAPWPEIERRLATGPSQARREDLSEAYAQLMRTPSISVDLVLRSDRLPSEIAAELLERLGWNGPPPR